MEKPPYCVNSEEGLEKIKELRRYAERFPYGTKNEDMVPRITGEDAEQLVAELRAHDRFRAKSLEVSGGKILG